MIFHNRVKVKISHVYVLVGTFNRVVYLKILSYIPGVLIDIFIF